jgi:hypothetical protein
MASPKTPGYKGLNGTCYTRVPLDSRLIGYGMPPNDPAYQQDSAGGGTFKCVDTFILVSDDGTITEDV